MGKSRERSAVYTYDGMPAFIKKRRPPGGVPKKKRKRTRKALADKGITKLTKMQRGALTKFMEQGFRNKKGALEAAGYAKGIGAGYMDKLVARKPIIAALEKKGVTDDKIAQGMAEGIKAMHIMKPKMPDHHARIKFIAEANRVLDNYPAKKIQVEQRNLQVILTGEDMKQLQRFTELKRGADAAD